MAPNLSCRIAYQGEPGAFSEEAALLLAPSATLAPCHYFPELFASTRESRADLILAPIENTLAGAVTDSYDLLLHSGLFITAEVILPIHHQLIVSPGTKLSSIRTVLSHGVALAQCRRFFALHPALQPKPAHDTAGSVREMIAGGDTSVAAIASERASGIYGGEILLRNIEDSPRNFTRFLLLSEFENPGIESTAEESKFSLAVRLKFVSLLPAMLAQAMSKGAKLVNLVSRPAIDAPWNYYFYLDFLGSARSNCGDLSQFASEFKWLGRYRAAAPSQSA